MDIFGSDHKVLQIWPSLKLEPFILPELPKVHVHGEVLEEMRILEDVAFCANFSSALAKAPLVTPFNFYNHRMSPLELLSLEWRHSPNTPKNVPRVENPDELIVSGGGVKVGRLFVYKKSVRHPNKFDVLSPNHKFVQTRFPLKGQSWVLPKLSKIHVQREILKENSVNGLLYLVGTITVPLMRKNYFEFLGRLFCQV